MSVIDAFEIFEQLHNKTYEKPKSEWPYLPAYSEFFSAFSEMRGHNLRFALGIEEYPLVLDEFADMPKSQRPARSVTKKMKPSKNKENSHEPPRTQSSADPAESKPRRKESKNAIDRRVPKLYGPGSDYPDTGIRRRKSIGVRERKRK